MPSPPLSYRFGRHSYPSPAWRRIGAAHADMLEPQPDVVRGLSDTSPTVKRGPVDKSRIGAAVLAPPTGGRAQLSALPPTSNQRRRLSSSGAAVPPAARPRPTHAGRSAAPHWWSRADCAAFSTAGSSSWRSSLSCCWTSLRKLVTRGTKSLSPLGKASNERCTRPNRANLHAVRHDRGGCQYSSGLH